MAPRWRQRAGTAASAGRDAAASAGGAAPASTSEATASAGRDAPASAGRDGSVPGRASVSGPGRASVSESQPWHAHQRAGRCVVSGGWHRAGVSGPGRASVSGPGPSVVSRWRRASVSERGHSVGEPGRTASPRARPPRRPRLAPPQRRRAGPHECHRAPRGAAASSAGEAVVSSASEARVARPGPTIGGAPTSVRGRRRVVRRRGGGVVGERGRRLDRPGHTIVGEWRRRSVRGGAAAVPRGAAASSAGRRRVVREGAAAVREGAAASSAGALPRRLRVAPPQSSAGEAVVSSASEAAASPGRDTPSSANGAAASSAGGAAASPRVAPSVVGEGRRRVVRGCARRGGGGVGERGRSVDGPGPPSSASGAAAASAGGDAARPGGAAARRRARRRRRRRAGASAWPACGQPRLHHFRGQAQDAGRRLRSETLAIDQDHRNAGQPAPTPPTLRPAACGGRPSGRARPRCRWRRVVPALAEHPPPRPAHRGRRAARHRCGCSRAATRRYRRCRPRGRARPTHRPGGRCGRPRATPLHKQAGARRRPGRDRAAARVGQSPQSPVVAGQERGKRPPVTLLRPAHEAGVGDGCGPRHVDGRFAHWHSTTRPTPNWATHVAKGQRDTWRAETDLDGLAERRQDRNGVASEVGDRAGPEAGADGDDHAHGQGDGGTGRDGNP